MKKYSAAKRSRVKQATHGCQQIILAHERVMGISCRDAEEAMLVQAIQASLSGNGDDSAAPLANGNREQVKQNPPPSVTICDADNGWPQLKRPKPPLPNNIQAMCIGVVMVGMDRESDLYSKSSPLRASPPFAVTSCFAYRPFHALFFHQPQLPLARPTLLMKHCLASFPCKSYACGMMGTAHRVSLQGEGAHGGRPDSDNHTVRSRVTSNDSFSVSPLLPKVRNCPHVQH